MMLCGAPLPLWGAWLLCWGATVSGDSPQFSAITAANAPRAMVGSVLTFVNARWAAVTQERAELAVGRRLQDLVEPADSARAAALFDAQERSGARTAQVSLRSADGGLRQYEVAVVPLYSHTQLVGFAGSAVDVTEREVAQQRLHEAQFQARQGQPGLAQADALTDLVAMQDGLGRCGGGRGRRGGRGLHLPRDRPAAPGLRLA